MPITNDFTIHFIPCKGPSINYVVSVGGEGGTPKDDLRRRGEGGGAKVKLCCLFAFRILPFFEIPKTQNVFLSDKLLQKFSALRAYLCILFASTCYYHLMIEHFGWQLKVII